MRWLDGLLVSLATLVAALGLAPLAARLWWILDLTTHFRLQYLGVTSIVLLLLALRRRWRPAMWLLAIGALNAWPVLPYLPRPWSAAPAPAAEPLKILTVNVSYRQFSPRRFHEIVAAAAPDVLLVVEFTPHAAEVLADFDKAFAYEIKAPAEGPYGIALWSRFPFTAAQFLSLGQVPAVEARIHSPAGDFGFLGVHLSAPTLPWRARLRNEELQRLAQRRATVEGPLVVAGDFNVTPYSPYFTDWLAATGLTDTRRGRTLSPSWPATLPILGIPIDHVAVTPDFGIRAHRQLPSFGSDHWAVLAELTLHPVSQSP